MRDEAGQAVKGSMPCSRAPGLSHVIPPVPNPNSLGLSYYHHQETKIPKKNTKICRMKTKIH